MINNLNDSIIENMLNGFALHRIITNKNGRAIDYEYIKINAAFEKMTGLNRANIIGQRVTKIIPGIEYDQFNWIEEYGKVALNDAKMTFEQYSEVLNKWYLINAYSPQKGYFITIFNDITDLKNKERELEKRNEELTAYNEELIAIEEELRQQMEELYLNQQLLAQSEQRLTAAQRIAHVGNWEIDLNTNTIWASEEVFRIYGIPRLSPFIPLKQAQAIVHKEDRPMMDLALKELLENGQKYDVEYRIIRYDDGAERYIHSVAYLECDEYGKPRKVIGVIQDITEKKRAYIELQNSHDKLTTLFEELTATEEELRQQFDELQLYKKQLELSEQKYRTLVDNSRDLIYSCDLKGNFVAVNQKFCRFVGLEQHQIIGKKYKQIIKDAKIHKTWYNAFQEVLKTGQIYIMETRKLLKTNEYMDFTVTMCPVFDSNNNIIGITVTEHDITEYKQNMDTIHQLAYYDSLTGLPNAVLFEDRLKIAINLAKRTGEKLALVFIDIDNFKKVNDTLGHLAGDALLKEISIQMSKSLRDCDTLARRGGDEFTVLMPKIKKTQDITNSLEHLQEVIKTPYVIKGHTIYVTSSMGVAIYPDDAQCIYELLKNADIAMYKAKEVGKNNYQFVSDKLKVEIKRKMEIEQMLRRALENNSLDLYYQPQIELDSGRIRGIEALLRWSEKCSQDISTTDIIAVAEETGLIVPIGEWVMKEACRMLKKCHSCYLPGIIMSVNISAFQLRQKGFVNSIMNILKSIELEPKYLELEITESLFIDSFEETLVMLDELRNIGVKISLDDFGTGYSSLSYLMKLPLDSLKIDREFLQDLTNTKKENITSCIISLGKKLDLDIIAEGIETEEQIQYLKQFGNIIIQGYLLCKPMSETDLIKKMKDKSYNIMI